MRSKPLDCFQPLLDLGQDPGLASSSAQRSGCAIGVSPQVVVPWLGTKEWDRLVTHCKRRFVLVSMSRCCFISSE